MNKLIDTILNRTCVRDFLPDQVSGDQINTILKTAQSSPSAKNRQPWFLIVIKNKKLLGELAVALNNSRTKQFANFANEKQELMMSNKSNLCSNDSSISNAPVSILVFRNSNGNYKEASEQEYEIKEEQSVASCAYSILLSAEALGIGSVWNCSVLYAKEEIKNLLQKYKVNWNDNWQPRAIIPIGMAKRKPKKPKRKDLDKISVVIP